MKITYITIGLKKLFIGCCDETKNVSFYVSICKVKFSTLLGPLEKISKKVNLVFLADKFDKDLIVPCREAFSPF